MGGLFILIGIPVLLAGLVTLLRPSLIRSLFGMPDNEAATYGLRIAGMMIAAFGLLLAGFATAYRLSAPAYLNSTGGIQ